jgi:hypothetical protein
MVATGTVVLSYLGYVFPSTIGAAGVQVQGVVIIGIIVLSAVLANQRFRLTQNIVNVVCVLYAVAIGLVVLAGVVHLAGGVAPETNPADLSACDVLRAAVTVIWCMSMVVLFVDVVIIIRRFLPRYQETRLARPAVFYTCSVIGGLSVLIALIATLSGSWTPLISNDSGSISIAGADIAYGAWFYLVAGIAVLSLLVTVCVYWLGNATSARAAREKG